MYNYNSVYAFVQCVNITLGISCLCYIWKSPPLSSLPKDLVRQETVATTISGSVLI